MFDGGPLRRVEALDELVSGLEPPSASRTLGTQTSKRGGRLWGGQMRGRGRALSVVSHHAERLVRLTVGPRGVGPHVMAFEGEQLGIAVSGRYPHSHSMVPGGLEVTSRATRLTPSTSAMMREASRCTRS